MSGPNSPRGLRKLQGHGTSRRRLWALGAGSVLAVGATQSSCGFPDYSFSQAGSGAGGSANGGTAGIAGLAGGGGKPTGGAGSTGVAGDAGSAGTGGDPGAAGAAGDTCIYQAPSPSYAHCSDKAISSGETGIDCGGAECLPCDGTQSCLQSTGCTSGNCTAAKTCSPILNLQYTSIVSDAQTRTPKFNLQITYLDSKQVMLSELSIRYYFNHNGVDEPVIPLDTQGTLQLGSSQVNIAPNTYWKIHRFPLGPADANNHRTDSYLEIKFTSQVLLTTGAKIDLTQDIVAGSNAVNFDQNSHYSFMNAPSAATNEAITVYRAIRDANDVIIGAERIWGVDPPMNLLPACAYSKGVNVGGDMVEVDGRVLDASSGQVQFAGTPYSTATPKLTPVADMPTTTMLSTAFPLSSSMSATWTVPQGGKYWVYAWVTSASSAESGVLAVQGNPTDRFVGTQAGSAYWSLMGPYAVTVADDLALQLTSAGKVNVAGLMLYRAQP